MRSKTFRAETVAGAMAQIRTELGPDALIIDTCLASGGAEVTAYIDEARLPTPDLADPPAPGPSIPPSRSRAWKPRPLHSALTWHGVPSGLAAKLAVADLAAGLGQVLSFGTLPLDAETPLLLAGAPGAGKTLTTARLATRLVLAGQTPLVISADGKRAGAAEELAAYTRLLGIELVVAHRPATLARALRMTSSRPVLIDTAGINAFDPSQLQDVQALAAEARARCVLVMAAGGDPIDAQEQAELFAAIGTKHLIPTRLDIARRLGAVLAAAEAGMLTLSLAGTGPGATDGLTLLTPDALAERLRLIPAPLNGVLVQS